MDNNQFSTKKMDAERTAQRFSPRKPNSNWTELNKERARRLIIAGLMMDAGKAKLPDLTLKPLEIAPDILEALQAHEQTEVDRRSIHLCRPSSRLCAFASKMALVNRLDFAQSTAIV